MIDFYVFEKCSALEYQVKVQELAQKYTIPMSRVLLDQDGIGWGIVGNLQCKGFQNGSRPIDNRSKREQEQQGGKPQYQNLKTQCYMTLADPIHEAKINLSIMERWKEEIVQELNAYEEVDTDKE